MDSVGGLLDLHAECRGEGSPWQGREGNGGRRESTVKMALGWGLHVRAKFWTRED